MPTPSPSRPRPRRPRSTSARHRQADARQLRQHGDGLQRRDASSAASLPTRSRSAAALASLRQSIDLGAGSDMLDPRRLRQHRLGLERRDAHGGSGADTITFATQVSNGSIDLGAGADKLTSRAGSPTRRPSSNVETIVGGSGNDTITLGTIASNATIDLGAGSDKLDARQLRQRGDDLERRDPRRRHGRRHASPSARRSSASSSIDLGAGIDKLTLADSTNDGSIANVETLIGGSAARHHHARRRWSPRPRSTSARAPTS